MKREGQKRRKIGDGMKREYERRRKGQECRWRGDEENVRDEMISVNN